MNTAMMVCNSDPCQNKGTCHELSNGRFKCDCTDGFDGKLCEGDYLFTFKLNF